MPDNDGSDFPGSNPDIRAYSREIYRHLSWIHSRMYHYTRKLDYSSAEGWEDSVKVRAYLFALRDFRKRLEEIDQEDE